MQQIMKNIFCLLAHMQLIKLQNAILTPDRPWDINESVSEIWVKQSSIIEQMCSLLV